MLKPQIFDQSSIRICYSEFIVYKRAKRKEQIINCEEKRKTCLNYIQNRNIILKLTKENNSNLS